MVAYGNALKSTTTDVDELIKITGSLTLEQTKNVLSNKALSEETVKAVLASRNLTDAEVQATTATIAKTGATQLQHFLSAHILLLCLQMLKPCWRQWLRIQLLG